MSEKIHFLIKELLPLYVDGDVEEAVNDIIEDHLQLCEICQNELNELKSGKDTLGFYSKEKETHEQPIFIKRLKKLGLMIGVILVAIMIVSMTGSWFWGREVAEEKQLEQEQHLVRLDDNLESLSPSREAIMEKSGVKINILEKRFTQQESSFKYRYTWHNPKIDYVREDFYWPNKLIAMDLTNNQILERKENDGLGGYMMNKESWNLSGIKSNTEIIGIEMPNLAVFYRPDTFRIPLNEKGETSIRKKITVNGINFLIYKAEVTDERFLIYYEQMDQTSQVGLYELSFNIIDSNGKNWTKEPNIDFQNEKLRIFRFPYFKGMKFPITLELEHAVLIVPGMHYKFPVK